MKYIVFIILLLPLHYYQIPIELQLKSNPYPFFLTPLTIKNSRSKNNTFFIKPFCSEIDTANC